MFSSRNHSLFEFSTITCNNIGAFCLSLEFHGHIEILANDLIRDKVVDSLLNFAIGFSGNVNDIFDEVSLVALKLLTTNLILLLPINSGNVFQNQDIFLNAFLLEELCAVS